MTLTRAHLPLALLLGVSVFAWVGHLFVFGDPTADADWKKAAEFVEAEIKPDELVRVVPDWSEAPLVHLGSNAHANVDRRRKLLPEDLVGASAFWIIHEKGRWSDAVEALPGRVEELQRKRFDSVEVAQIRIQDVPRYERLSDRLKDARVSLVDGAGTQTPCRWTSRWTCSVNRRYVAQEVHEVGDEPRHCIYAVPVGGDKTLRVEFPGIDVSQGVVVRSGVSLHGTRAPSGPDVKFTASIKGQEPQSTTFAYNDDRWHRMDLKGEGRGDLVFDVWAESSHRRHFCFDAYVTSARD